MANARRTQLGLRMWSFPSPPRTARGAEGADTAEWPDGVVEQWLSAATGAGLSGSAGRLGGPSHTTAAAASGRGYVTRGDQPGLEGIPGRIPVSSTGALGVDASSAVALSWGTPPTASGHWRNRRPPSQPTRHRHPVMSVELSSIGLRAHHGREARQRGRPPRLGGAGSYSTSSR